MAANRPKTPKIALALGGGIARGWAHIGVIRGLQANGVNPDILCGTSIGALTAGLHAIDKLDALEQWARSLNRKRIYSLLDFTFGASGLFGGERLAQLLNEQAGGINIEDIPKPFLAVATELKTGQEIWLRQGSLIKAIRASYAMPGVFPPQDWEGMALVDGALVNPCPISAARAMGGRLVIAVSLHSDIEGAHAADPDQPELPLPIRMEAAGPFSAFGKWLRPDRMILEHIFGDGSRPTVSSVMIGALNILLDRVTRARIAGDPPDVLIAPKVGAIGLIDFHRADELIRLGRQAADEAMPRIESAIERLR